MAQLIYVILVLEVPVFACVGWYKTVRSPADFMFSVQIEPSFRETEAARRIFRQFAWRVVRHSIIAMIITTLGVLIGHPEMITIGAFWCVVGLSDASNAARADTEPHGLTPVTVREASLMTRSHRLVGGWLGQSGPFLILGAEAWWARQHWDHLPGDPSLNAAGTGFVVTRTAASVYGGLATAAFFCLCIVLVALKTTRVRRAHAGGPLGHAESVYQEIMQAIVLGLEYSTASEAALSLLSRATEGPWPKGGSMFPWMGHWIYFVLAVLLPGLAVASVFIARAQTLTRRDSTTGDVWMWGQFYVNPNDPALFVPERGGSRRTLNWGHKKAWMIAASFMAGFSVVIGLVCFLFFHLT